MNSDSLGRQGEEQACDYLRSRGVQVLQTRYRAADGEIDIIARDGAVLCFIEVKYRPQGRLGDGVQSVTPQKRQRMQRAALEYLRTHPHPPRWRYDTLEITRAGIWYAKAAAQPLQRDMT
jgi:putative endonuclease